jgi:Uncharacterized enzyme of heme biosynthesis
MSRARPAVFALVVALSSFATCGTVELSAQAGSWASEAAAAGEDSATKSAFSACDALVAQRRYLSAYQALDAASKESELLIAKRVELCTNYFVQSLSHRMFAFADLKEGESLDSLRQGTGSYTMVSFDPAQAVADYLKGRPLTPLLARALGDYYYDVLLRYSGRWLESDEAINAKIVANYEIAIAGGSFDSLSLANCGEACLRSGDAAKAAGYYKRSLGLGMDSANAHYNAAYAYLNSGDLKSALAEARKAIDRYSDNPNYRFDALLLASDAQASLGDTKAALSFLDAARAISLADYRLYKKSMPLYLALGDTDSALREAHALFALAPRNPAATQMVMDAYYGARRYEALAAFFDAEIKNRSGDAEAQGNLYYHYSMLAHDGGDDARARSLLDAAERAFKKAGVKDEGLFDTIGKQRASYGG